MCFFNFCGLGGGVYLFEVILLFGYFLLGFLVLVDIGLKFYIFDVLIKVFVVGVKCSWYLIWELWRLRLRLRMKVV